MKIIVWCSGTIWYIFARWLILKSCSVSVHCKETTNILCAFSVRCGPGRWRALRCVLTDIRLKSSRIMSTGKILWLPEFDHWEGTCKRREKKKVQTNHAAKVIMHFLEHSMEGEPEGPNGSLDCLPLA